MRIENPITWLQSKRAISDNPLVWFRPQKHYKNYETTVAKLDQETIATELQKYNHVLLGQIGITGLGLTAGLTSLMALAPHIGAEATALSVGPIGAFACLVGATRGVIREGEKQILKQALEEKGSSSTTVYEAPNSMPVSGR